jgi:phosphatidylserine/phosphatidylglycerophosphate/cardiolipin synthase-like enzyme
VNDIQVTFLRDTQHGGGSTQPKVIAGQLADFVKKANSSIHIAIYDFRLSDKLGDELVASLIERADRGVDVKIAYDHTKPNSRTGAAFTRLGGDMAPKGTHKYLPKKFGASKVQPQKRIDYSRSTSRQARGYASGRRQSSNARQVCTSRCAHK